MTIIYVVLDLFHFFALFEAFILFYFIGLVVKYSFNKFIYYVLKIRS